MAPEASRKQVHAGRHSGPGGLRSVVADARSARRSSARAADIIRRNFLSYADLSPGPRAVRRPGPRGMQVGVGAARSGATRAWNPSLPPQMNEAGPFGKAAVMGALAVRQPVGVVTCGHFLNNPWANRAGKIAPALAMGNTVVVKPAQDPLSVYRMAQALEAAGVPQGVVNVVSGWRVRRSARRPNCRGRGHGQLHRLDGGGRPRTPEVCGRGMKRQLMEPSAGRARRSSSTTRTSSGGARHRHDVLLLQRPRSVRRRRG